MAEKEYAPKKMLTLHILDILKRFSDEEHRLSQKQIQDILADENEKYKMSVDRKAIKRNLQDLIDAGYDIQCEERNRGSGETANSIKTGFYIERDFTNVELKYLIDSVVFSRHIPYRNQSGMVLEPGGVG